MLPDDVGKEALFPCEGYEIPKSSLLRTGDKCVDGGMLSTMRLSTKTGGDPAHTALSEPSSLVKYLESLQIIISLVP